MPTSQESYLYRPKHLSRVCSVRDFFLHPSLLFIEFVANFAPKFHSQQAVSSLTNTNSTLYADEVGTTFTKFGVEYWSDPSSRDDGFVEWVADVPVCRIDNNVLSGDPSVNISSRLIPEEPMSIILNLAISGEWTAMVVTLMCDLTDSLRL